VHIWGFLTRSQFFPSYFVHGDVKQGFGTKKSTTRCFEQPKERHQLDINTDNYDAKTKHKNKNTKLTVSHSPVYLYAMKEFLGLSNIKSSQKQHVLYPGHIYSFIVIFGYFMHNSCIQYSFPFLQLHLLTVTQPVYLYLYAMKGFLVLRAM
jgi:hypothetical protein